MSIAAYLRISSDKQDVSRQRQSILAWAARTGQTIAHWFEDSEGRNPRDLAHKRAGFQRLLKAVEAGLVSCIVVDSQDRFGVRDAYQWGAFLTNLKDNNCILIDASGKVLSGDDDAAVLTGVIGAQTSRREQKEKAHRNVSGKIPQAKQGIYQGGYPPYGLDVVCFGADGKEKWRSVYVGHYDRLKTYPDGRQDRFEGKDNSPVRDATDVLRLRPTILKERLKTVRDIFAWYATEAISPRQLATRLTQLGVDPIFGAWDKVKILQTLRNPVYIGLPTWNKRGGARFAEFINGQIREVTTAKARHRAATDFVQPDAPQFEPIIDEATWNKVQRKVVEASSKQTAIKKHPSRTAELWLKPYLVCGQCGKSMRATVGDSKNNRVWPSYFCGTYGTYGAENPTGCHCHRIHHSVLEKIIFDYLNRTAPKVGKLLAATKGANLEAIRPLLEAVNESAVSHFGLECDLMTFVEENVNERDLKRQLKAGRSCTEIYGSLLEKMRPAIEADIQGRERELDAMLDDFRTLSPRLRERANAKMEALQSEINRLRAKLADLREPWADFGQELTTRRDALKEAQKTLSSGAAGRQKTEALSGVIDRVVCHFRHTKTAEQKNNGKSYLDKVEIVPVSGDSLCFTNGNKPGRG